MRADSSRVFPIAAFEYAFVLLGVCALLLIPLSGCELSFDSDGTPTLGEAFSNLGDAGQNTWDDFEDWWDHTF